MKIGGKEFPSGVRTYVMGILNVTPDSFSDGGKYDTIEQAVKQAEKMIQDGADVIDVGGESTRPGYVKISDEEEIRRVVPVIQELKARFDIPVSIDTYKGAVAEAALVAGADLLNDIWGFQSDETLADLASRYEVPVCLMHNRENPHYHNFRQDVIEDLKISLSIARKYGIPDERILLDPGIGFAKTYEQNLELLHHLDEIAALGYPVLLGASRKSVIGTTLELPTQEREEGTIAVSVWGAMQGCDFVRVHDVRKNVRALKMADAILHAE